MEHLYTAYTKIVQGKTYYFVKKMMALSEYDKSLVDIVIGYGMHTDFDKACNIAGIDDAGCRKQILLDLQEASKPANAKIPAKHSIDIAESVSRWLAGQGAEVLN